MIRKTLERSWPFLALVWAVVVLGGYLLIYPPASLITHDVFPVIRWGRHLLSSFTSFGMLFVFMISAAGWGYLAVAMFCGKPAVSSRCERGLSAWAVGAGMIGLAVYAGDTIGIVSPWFYVSLLAVGAVCAAVAARRYMDPLHLHRPPIREAGVLVCSALPVMLSLVGALAPPTQFDSLVYHLSYPAQYLHHGGLFAIQYSLFFAFPQLMEMLFQLAIAIRGDVLANLISWVYFPLTAVVIYAYCTRFAPADRHRTVGCIAALIWACTPAAVLLATGTYVDIPLTFYSMMLLYVIARWEADPDSRHWLALAGILWGIAMGIKYTGVVIGVYGTVVVCAVSPRQSLMRNIRTYALPAAIVFGPWLLKNIVLLNNPIAPWGCSLFSRSIISPDVARSYTSHIAAHGPAMDGILSYLTLPWRMTVSGVSFGGAYDMLGPLFMIFIPFAMGGYSLSSEREKSRMLYRLFLPVALVAVAWISTGKVLRFLMPAIPPLCILSAVGVFAAMRARPIIRAALITVLGVGLVHNILLARWILAGAEPWTPVLAGENRERYLARKVNYFPCAQAASALPPGSFTVLFGEQRSYYIDSRVMAPTLFDHHPLIDQANAASDADHLAARVRDLGFTHVLIHEHEAVRIGLQGRFSREGIRVWEAFKERNLKPVYADRYCGLYEIDNH